VPRAVVSLTRVQVLDHFNYELNTRLGGIEDCDGNRVRVRIMLLGGADLVETFSQPGVWSPVDLNHMYVVVVWFSLG
jgi:nicotinamide mononucleotide adenylyltransferase